MAITSGFYNSKNGDRVYDAEQMGSLFGGIITDGVFGNYPTTGEHFIVTKDAASGPMYVKVGRGKAWFHNTWIDNSAPFSFELATPSLVYPRKDSLFFKVDKSTFGRTGGIMVVTGEYPANPTDTPVAPTKTNTDTVFWHRLADITIAPGEPSASSIQHIKNWPGELNETPYITAPLEHVSCEDILDDWKADVDAFASAEVARFLSDQDSVLSTLIRVIPAIWLCTRDVPTAAGSTVTYADPSDQYLSANFSPDFRNQVTVRSRNIPKQHDIVIGQNGYYGEISAATINDSNGNYAITITGLGRTFLNDIYGNVETMIQETPMVWLCDTDLPDTSGASMDLSKPMPYSPDPCTFYPDFGNDEAIRLKMVPKVGDVIIGKNGYYATITFMQHSVASGAGWFTWNMTVVGTGKYIATSATDSARVFQITFGGLDPYNDTPRVSRDVTCDKSFHDIYDAYQNGYTLTARILMDSAQIHGGTYVPDSYVYAPLQLIFDHDVFSSIKVTVINTWGQTQGVDTISYTIDSGDDVVGTYDSLYVADIAMVSARIPRSATYDSSTGVISFKNSSGQVLFTCELPVYDGNVEEEN